jgi:hypothetical protein
MQLLRQHLDPNTAQPITPEQLLEWLLAGQVSNIKVTANSVTFSYQGHSCTILIDEQTFAEYEAGFPERVEALIRRSLKPST